MSGRADRVQGIRSDGRRVAFPALVGLVPCDWTGRSWHAPCSSRSFYAASGSDLGGPFAFKGILSLDVVLLIAGIGLLLAGGHLLVTGASQLASSLGLSELAIGLTVVAFGTSAPELAVNVGAALAGDTALAFGNVIGSNIANIGLVIGLCAITRPLLIENVVISREIPMLLLASVATVILGLDGVTGRPEMYDRTDGMMLLLMFTIFLYYTVVDFRSRSAPMPLSNAAGDFVRARPLWNRSKALVLATLGLGALIIGTEWTVSSAVSLAERLGASKDVLGLTIVAVGTSLPELVTSLVATRKGQTNLAIGNVVGSNIFNLLFVLGTTAVIRPVALPEVGGRSDLLAMLVMCVVLVPIARSRESRIPRAAGFALVLGYSGYMTWRWMV